MEEQNQPLDQNNQPEQGSNSAELGWKMTDRQIIENNEKWFSFFAYLPRVITIILGILVFLGGIISSSLDVSPLVVWLVGGIVCAIVYCALKLTLCYQILNIYYLKEIEKNTRKKD
jgi:hypothetical protein